jgi:hypothetical protein
LEVRKLRLAGLLAAFDGADKERTENFEFWENGNLEDREAEREDGT